MPSTFHTNSSLLFIQLLLHEPKYRVFKFFKSSQLYFYSALCNTIYSDEWENNDSMMQTEFNFAVKL